MQVEKLRPGLTPPGFCVFGGGHVNVTLIAAELEALAERARRLPPPNSRRPECFHEARDELANDIRVIAEHVRGKKPAPAPIDAERPTLARAPYAIEHINGRTTLVVNKNARRPPPSPGGP
jgi:hypothetical protein